MEPIQFYTERAVDLGRQLDKLKQKKRALGWLRFSSVIGIFAVFYFLWAAGAVYIAGGVVALVALFIVLVKRDLENLDRIKHLQLLIEVNQNELKALHGDITPFDGGLQHLPKEHEYAADLDIFGSSSLFRYLNRTTSEAGSKTLAACLLKAAPIDLINQRKKAARELTEKISFMQHFMAEGKKHPLTLGSIERLNRWMETPPLFSRFAPWKVLRYLLPAIIITITTLFFLDLASSNLFYLTLFIFAVIAYQIDKKVAPVHDQLSDIAKEMATLTQAMRLIEQETFSSPLLTELQAAFQKNEHASRSVGRLQKILERLDLRYNIMLSLPLNLLLLWNLQQMLDLEKWKKDRRLRLQEWIDAIGTLEALNSFAVLRFNHPAWVWADVVPDYFKIHGKEIGHPLIPAQKRVNNPIDMHQRGCIFLLTGSNMAGKSTYLRSIGVNVVLALAGAPVCATEFSVSHVRLMSSMRIADNLEESTSTFYAELKKLKAIIEQVREKEPVFILLDEILRGTNSNDRHTGSKALMKQFLEEETAAIIATHDLELAVWNNPEECILNYHFDVSVENEELYFDYKLKPGICTSLNASILMRKIGIEI